MRRDIYVFSSKNGSLISFKKSFEVKSSDPPPKGSTVALGMIGEPRGTLKQGEVKDVRVTESSMAIKVGTEDASTEVLRSCLIQDGWEEVPNQPG